MIVELNGYICQGNIGNKARSLIDLNRYGFKVPASVALDTREYINITRKIKDKINLLLKRVDINNIDMISKQIQILLDTIELNQDTINEIINILQSEESYILRCSIDGVDDKYTYAGLLPTYMGVNKDNIIDYIIKCYKSLFSYNSLYYMLKNHIDYSNIAVAIIIQREIKTNKLGYIMTMNPITLNTEELMIDIVENKRHEKCIYNYMINEFTYEESYKLLSKNKMIDTIELVKDIQNNLGYPVEIELGYTKDDIYVLQTRELTSILYENHNGILKKQKIAAKRFMWSLVSSSYHDIISKYYINLGLEKPEIVSPLLFNNCYFNILNISEILEQYLNYSDDYFYDCLHFMMDIPKKNNWSTKLSRHKNQKRLKQSIKIFLEKYPLLFEDYQKMFKDYCHNMTKVNPKKIETAWVNLVFSDYKELCSNYIDLQIIIFIERNNLFNALKNILNIKEFNNIIEVEEEMCDYKINKEFKSLIRKIKNDISAYRYWFSTSSLKILNNYNNKLSSFYHPEFQKFIDNYGYLSYFDMDFSEDFYVEDVEDVIRDIKKQLANFEDLETNTLQRKEIIKKLQSSISKSKYEKIDSSLTTLQSLLIKSSELKNCLFKFNFIVKRYTKMLAKLLYTRKVLETENDIWHLDINTIYDYIEGEIDADGIKDNVSKNKNYYNAYRNFKDIDIIGNNKETLLNYDYEGTGCSTGIIEGKVRMIKSLKDLSTLEKDDILVTKTINSNLLFQLPEIKGIIISDFNLEQGVKDIIREMRIPCIILDSCSKKLNNNMIIKADCVEGTIKILKKSGK